jgi:hypothetical protein
MTPDLRGYLCDQIASENWSQQYKQELIDVVAAIEDGAPLTNEDGLWISRITYLVSHYGLQHLAEDTVKETE